MNITDNQHLLSLEWEELIKQTATLSFCFGSFKNWEDFHQKEKVEVVIESQTDGLAVLHQKAIDSLKKEIDDSEVPIERKKEIQEQINEISDVVVLGEYKPAEKKVYLYIKTITEKPSNHDNYLVTTYIHEMMHAYFDRTGHEKFSYIFQIEEPLAEAGMLLFLEILNDSRKNWAYQNVKSKFPVLKDYAKGADLFDGWKNRMPNLLQIVTEYKNNYIANSTHIIANSTYNIASSNYNRTKRDAFEDYLLRKSYSHSSAVAYACVYPLAKIIKQAVFNITNKRTDNLYDVLSQNELFGIEYYIHNNYKRKNVIHNNPNIIDIGSSNTLGRYVKTIFLYLEYLSITKQLLP